MKVNKYGLGIYPPNSLPPQDHKLRGGIIVWGVTVTHKWAGQMEYKDKNNPFPLLYTPLRTLNKQQSD